MANTVKERLAQREFYLKGLDIKEYKDIKTVIGTGYNTEGRPKAVAFTGTRGKPDFYYNFETEQQREEYINQFIEKQKNKLQRKQEMQAKKQAPALAEIPFKIGDIIYNSWGWEQTNIDFYEITRVTKASVFIRPIQGEYTDEGYSNMSGFLKPIKGKYTGREQRKAIQWHNGNPYIKFEFGGYSKYQEGEEIYCSWYA